MSAVLVACSHGTRSLDGQATMGRLVDDIRALRPGLDVRAAFVDVQAPAVADVVREALRTRPGPRGATSPRAVVVPLLLSTGVHVRHDIGRAVADPRAAAAAHLGPDDRLVDVLAERLVRAGARSDDAIVVAAAGSSDPAARVDVGQVVAGLAARRWGPVTVGYCAGAGPSVREAVEAARALGGRRVVVAAYLLAPGVFHSSLQHVGADVVTAPLGPHPYLADIALDRFDRVVTAVAAVPAGSAVRSGA